MFTIAFLQNLSMVELIIIGVVALLIFGSSLPKMARNMGKGIMQFKRGVQEAKSEMSRELDAEADRQEEEERRQKATRLQEQNDPVTRVDTGGSSTAESPEITVESVHQGAEAGAETTDHRSA